MSLRKRIAGSVITTVITFLFLVGALAANATASDGAVSVDEYYYDTLAVAVSHVQEGDILQLNKDITESLTIDKCIILDLNGHSVDGTLVVADGVTVYVKDTATADFTVDTGYGKITTQGDVRAEDGYIAITEKDGTSYHRLDLEMRSVVLRTSAAGIYYTGNFGGDQIVKEQIASYGMVLSVYELPTAEQLKADDYRGAHTTFSNSSWVCGQVGKAKSTVLTDILKESNSLEVNIANGKMQVQSVLYVWFKDGTVLFGEPFSLSFRQLVEAVDAQIATLTQSQKNGLRAMYYDFASTMDTWEIPNLQQLSSEPCNHMEVIDPAVLPTCTETGLTEGKHCGICGAVIVEQEIIPAAHNFASDICSVCGEHRYLVFTLLDDGSYSIKARDVEGIPATFIIPSTFNNRPVTQIDRNGFARCKTIERLLIPEGITRIDWNAFSECENISQIVYNATDCKYNTYHDNIREIFDGAGSATDGIRVVIGANVQRIPAYLFAAENIPSKCNVVSVDFMEGSVCEEIGFGAFGTNAKLKSIVLPDSVTNINTGAFHACSALESIYIPAGITTIPHQVFSNCYNLADVYYGGSRDQWQQISIGAWNDPLLTVKKHYASTEAEYFNFTMQYDGTYSISAKDVSNMPDEVIIPSTYNEAAVTKIDDYAFAFCTNLLHVTIPSGITTIGNDAFAYCENLISANISDSLTDIGDNAFRYCIALNGIAIPDTVTNIGNNAFAYCTSLTGVCVPNGITIIPFGLFDSCYSLKSVLLPAETYYIEQNAFLDCNCLSNIYFKGTETQWQSIGVGDGNDAVFYAGLVCREELTPTADEYFVFTLLDNDTYSIRVDRIENMPSEVVIPSSYNGKAVTVIEEWAFCPRRNNDAINNITSIVIPDSIVEIGGAAFSDCEKLTSIKIPEGVTYLDIGAFQRCSNLRSIYLPKGLQAVYDTAFLHCDKLTNIYYMGTEELWSEIGIGDWNDPFDNKTVTVHYNSMYV